VLMFHGPLLARVLIGVDVVAVDSYSSKVLAAPVIVPDDAWLKPRADRLDDSWPSALSPKDSLAEIFP
jgi:hypothetical protein